MTKLDELIEKLCPEGVKYETIGYVVNYEQPTKYIVKSTDYKDSFLIPVLTAGQSFILGYTNESDNIYNASKENPVIIFDDFTGSFKWVDFPFKVKSSAIKLLTENVSKTTLRYIYHIMGKINYSSDQHKRLWISIYSIITIPLPPLPVQREIVQILDNFTELTAELTAELVARKQQYEYYKNLIFSFGESSNIKWGNLYDISKNLDSKRKPVTKEYREKGEYPYYGASGIVDYVKDYIFEGDFLLVSEDGANLLARNTPIAFSASGQIWVNNHAHILQFKTYAERRFIEFYLNMIDLTKFISTAAQPKLTQDNLNKIPIPIIPLLEQQRIVNILDKFDKLVNDIIEGLPAEIAARQKQYEYYRDKLLTFKEVGNESI